MSGKVVLVTGASSGIGQALALQLAADGHTVYAGTRKPIHAKDGLIPVTLDVNKPAQIKAALKKIIKEQSRLDILVNNAGYGLYGAFEELDESQLRLQLETNFFGAARMIRAVLPQMRKQGSGLIGNVTSILGRMTIPTGSAYTSSKYALEALGETLRAEVRPFGIKVVSIEPGLIRTKFKENMVKSRSVKNSKSPYAFLNKLIDNDYEGYSTSSENAASKIVKILSKKNPGRRYRIGMDAHVLHRMLRCLPDQMIDFIMNMVVRTAWRRQAT